MEESNFEWMERTRLIDHVLLVVAVAGPVIVAALHIVLRKGVLRGSNPGLWVLGFVAGPILLLLWNVYNRVVDRYGIDSVFGLALNFAIFMGVAAVLIGLTLILNVAIKPEIHPPHESPPPPAPPGNEKPHASE